MPPWLALVVLGAIEVAALGWVVYLSEKERRR